MAMESWVTSISYAAANTVSDNCGQLFMTDDTGMLAGAQPVVKDIRQAWLPASLISWVTKGPTPLSSSRLLKGRPTAQATADFLAVTSKIIFNLVLMERCRSPSCCCKMSTNLRSLCHRARGQEHACEL